MGKIMRFIRRHPLTAILIVVLILASAFSGVRIWATQEMTKASEPYIIDVDAVTAFTFDPLEGEMGTIKYTIEEPAKIRIRLVDREDPELIHRTLVSYEMQEPGVHEVQWDGMDDSGNYVNPADVRVQIQGELMSTSISQQIAEKFSLVGNPYGHLHRTHDPDKCGFFTARFNYPESGATLEGIVNMEVEVLGTFRGYAEEGGIGIRGFIDKTMVLDQWLEPDDVRASFPFITWTLDTSAFDNGNHTLRLSMCDHKDHPGVASLKVTFDN